MIRRILTLFSAAAVFIAASLPVEASATRVWDGTADTAWYNETDTEFTISTAQELAGLSNLVYFGNSFSGKTVKLSADIVLNEGDLPDSNNPDVASWMQWTPIGSVVYHFKGTFDGQGHTVSGVFIDAFPDFQGLFGISDGTIKNLDVTNSFFRGTCFVSGICSQNFGLISNCYFSGTTIGNNFVSGICGYNEGTVENCFASGTSNSANIGTGGICGYNDGLLKSSYNMGSVNGINNVGGVCGCGDGEIANCYNIGSVCGTDNVGGVMGCLEKARTSVHDCFNLGIVSTNDKITSYTGGVCGRATVGLLADCFYLGYSGGIGLPSTTDAFDTVGQAEPILSSNELLLKDARTLIEKLKDSFGADFDVSVTRNGDAAQITITQNSLTSDGFTGEAEKLIVDVNGLSMSDKRIGFTTDAAIGVGILVVAAAAVLIFKKKLNK